MGYPCLCYTLPRSARNVGFIAHAGSIKFKDNEAFHLWMVVAVLPSSLYALTMGCKQHKRYQLLIWGIVGLALLVLALALGEERIGEWVKKALTVLGATLVAVNLAKITAFVKRTRKLIHNIAVRLAFNVYLLQR